MGKFLHFELSYNNGYVEVISKKTFAIAKMLEK